MQGDPSGPQTPGWILAAKAFGFTILWTVSYYTILYYMPTFTQKYAGLSPDRGAVVEHDRSVDPRGRGSRDGAMVGPDRPQAAADRLLRRLRGFELSAVLYHAVGRLAARRDRGPVRVRADDRDVLRSGPAAIAEIFPTHCRSTWMSTGYSLATCIFGGFAPFIATWLIEKTGSPVSPTYYLIAAAVISALVIAGLRETAHEKLG
jgi:MHS family proline/betaine transporter-like MFS transporter